jgi:ligand-binding sensor protein
LKLTDILPLEQWIELEKTIARKWGLNASVFNTEGIRITDYKKWANRLCPIIKANDKGQSFICAVAHMSIAKEAEREKKPVIEECDAGLVKIVVPVFVHDEFIGTAGGCGLLLDDGEVDPFLINKITGIEEAETERLSNDIKSFSEAEAKEVCLFIQEEIEEIINRSMRN